MSEPRTNQSRQTRLAHDARKEELLRAVIDVCAREGISKLSVSNITKHVGCTRSLFYHYFPNKEAALEAALDYTIDAFIERLRTWNAGRTRGDIEGALDSIAVLRWAAMPCCIPTLCTVWPSAARGTCASRPSLSSSAITKC